MAFRSAARVVLLTNGLGRTATQTQLSLLTRALVVSGSEPAIMSLVVDLSFDVDALGVPVAHVGREGCAASARTFVEAARVLDRWAPDALVTFGYNGSVLGRAAGRLAAVPTIITTIRNERVTGMHRELLLRATDQFATLSTTNSASAASELVARGVVNADRVTVVPDGIDVARYPSNGWLRAVTRTSFDIADDTFLWVTSGRLDSQADYEVLVDAFAYADHPYAELAIAGDGPARGALEARAAARNISGRVRFLGTVNDMPALLAAADAVVWPGSQEGSPPIVLEAMAGGRPVIASDTGSVRELVSDASGIIVARRTPWHFARALVDLAQLREQARVEMGIAGRERALEYHSLDVVSRAWLRVLGDAGVFVRRNTGAAARPPLTRTGAQP
jgi:glycosyltransferase involved in cell wall biosynthesis